MLPSDPSLVATTARLRDRSTRYVFSGCIPKRRVEIPIERAAPLRPTSHGFLPWRLSDDGPGARGSIRDGAVIRNPSQNRTHIEALILLPQGRS
jgi:hypothetical protein